MTNLIIANIISFFAAICTCLSSWSKKKTNIYYFQVAQCLLLAVANIFFQSYAAIISLLICALRNYLTAKERFTKTLCIILTAAIFILGILCNNKGYIGWIFIAANVIYTLGVYFCRKELSIKLNILLNLILWIIYEVLIIDIPSLIADSVAAVITVIAITGIYIERRKIYDNSDRRK